MQNLTSKQQHVLNFIEMYIDSHGESPTLFDIRDFLGVKALSTVHQHIKTLEQKGFLQRDNNTTRGINYVMNAGKYMGELIKIPMVGTIVAGLPIEAVEEVEDYITLPIGASGMQMAMANNYYALKVRGDSMIESYINEGDIVIVEQTTVVQDGDMVVALTENGDATLKFYYDEGKKVRLQPANEKYLPMYYPKGQLQIQGKVVQVIRVY